jgi:hypothetical protein
VRFAQENEGFFTLMFSPDLPPAGEKSERFAEDERAFGNLTAAISRCQQAGIIIEADPGKIASYLVLTPHGLASLAAQGGAGRFAENFGKDDFAYRSAYLTLAPFLTKQLQPEQIAALLE